MARDRIRRHRKRIRQAVNDYTRANPDATAGEVAAGVEKELGEEYGSAFLTLIMPLVLKLIMEWLSKR